MITWSIIVCTYNRPFELQKTLQQLVHLDYPRDQYEIIVVDNDPHGGPAEIANFPESRFYQIVYAKEEKLGLSNARNKGISVARGTYIAFIDDDAWPETNWLHELEKCFRDGGVACVGGRVEPDFPDNVTWPDWLHKRHFCFYSVIDFGAQAKLHYPYYPAGTNISFRKNIFDQAGIFSGRLGRMGESLLSMEETELCFRIEKAGYDIVYAPEAVVHHRIPACRLTREWLEQRACWQGISSALLEKEVLSAGTILRKTVKYGLVIAVGTAGTIVCKAIGSRRGSFFWSCQTLMCKSYLRAFWQWPRNRNS